MPLQFWVLMGAYAFAMYTTIITCITHFHYSTFESEDYDAKCIKYVLCINPYCLHRTDGWNWPSALIFGTIFALMNPIMLIVRGFWKLIHL